MKEKNKIQELMVKQIKLNNFTIGAIMVLH